jgi:hypothetical protein
MHQISTRKNIVHVDLEPQLSQENFKLKGAWSYNTVL